MDGVNAAAIISALGVDGAMNPEILSRIDASLSQTQANDENIQRNAEGIKLMLICLERMMKNSDIPFPVEAREYIDYYEKPMDNKEDDDEDEDEDEEMKQDDDEIEDEDEDEDEDDDMQILNNKFQKNCKVSSGQSTTLISHIWELLIDVPLTLFDTYFKGYFLLNVSGRANRCCFIAVTCSLYANYGYEMSPKRCEALYSTIIREIKEKPQLYDGQELKTIVAFENYETLMNMDAEVSPLLDVALTVYQQLFNVNVLIYDQRHRLMSHLYGNQLQFESNRESIIVFREQLPEHFKVIIHGSQIPDLLKKPEFEKELKEFVAIGPDSELNKATTASAIASTTTTKSKKRTRKPSDKDVTPAKKKQKSSSEIKCDACRKKVSQEAKNKNRFSCIECGIQAHKKCIAKRLSDEKMRELFLQSPYAYNVLCGSCHFVKTGKGDDKTYCVTLKEE